MKINIDLNSQHPKSKQIQRQISDRIRSGLIKESECLPSVRRLAQEIGVSPVTVIKAYSLLENDGLVNRIQGKGTYVKETTLERDGLNIPLDGEFDWQMTVKDYLGRAQFSKEMHLASFDDGYNLTEASINHQLLPTRQIMEHASDIFLKNISQLSDYATGEGDITFRKTLSRYFKSQNVQTQYENIIVTNGGQQGLNLIASTFTGPGDVVLIETPTYPGIIDIFASRGVQIVPVPLDRDGMRTDLLYRLCEHYNPCMVYTIPRFNNPTGISMSDKRKRELIEIAKTYNMLVVEDDPWGDIVFGREELIPLKSFDTDGHVIYVKGFSKLIGPTYRLGGIVSEGSVYTRLAAAKSNADLGSPIMIQKLVEPIFKPDKFRKYTKKLSKRMEERCNRVIRLLQKHGPQELTWIKPKGGINLWLSLKGKDISEALLLDYAYREKISILPGSIFYPGKSEYQHFRISFSYLDDENLDFAIIKLCHAINKYVNDNL